MYLSETVGSNEQKNQEVVRAVGYEDEAEAEAAAAAVFCFRCCEEGVDLECEDVRVAGAR